MNEKELILICFLITVLSLVLFILTYEEEFQETTIHEINRTLNKKGKLFGKIDYVVKNYPITIFVLNDGNTTSIYYPKATNLKTNNFVTVYAENQGEENLFAQKVVKE